MRARNPSDNSLHDHPPSSTSAPRPTVTSAPTPIQPVTINPSSALSTPLPHRQSQLARSSAFPQPAINGQAPPPPQVPVVYAAGLPLHQGSFAPTAALNPGAVPVSNGVAGQPSNTPPVGPGDVGSVNGRYAPHLSFMESQLATQAMLMDQQRRIQQLERELAHSRNEIMRLKACAKDKEAVASEGSSRGGSRGTSDTMTEKKTISRYWTNEEHKRFLEGLDLFGQKDIKSIAKHVGSRSATQVRTHAQKYYLRLQREKQKRDTLEQERSAKTRPSSTTTINGPAVSTKSTLQSPARTHESTLTPMQTTPVSTTAAEDEGPSVSASQRIPPISAHAPAPSSRGVVDRSKQKDMNNAASSCRNFPRAKGRRRSVHTSKRELRQLTSDSTPRQPPSSNHCSPKSGKRARTSQASPSTPERKRRQPVKAEPQPAKNEPVLAASENGTKEGTGSKEVKREVKPTDHGTNPSPKTKHEKGKGGNICLPGRRVVTAANTCTQDSLPSASKVPSALKRLTHSSSVLSDLNKGLIKPLSRTNSFLFGGRELRRSNSILSLLSGIPTSLRESTSTDRLANLLPIETQDDKPPTSLRSLELNGSTGNLSSALMGDRSLSLVHLNMLSEELDPAISSGPRDTDWS